MHYKLPAIIAVGYKVNSERAVQFRKWATTIIDEYTIKAYVMDDERIQSGGSILTEQYFEEQLQRVWETRVSERKFYQKITDIYATAIDYDVTAQAKKRFFATVQNRLHTAIHGQTAAEVIVSRADAEKQYMGLTTWKDGPKGKIQKFDGPVLETMRAGGPRTQAWPSQGKRLGRTVSMGWLGRARRTSRADQRKIEQAGPSAMIRAVPGGVQMYSLFQDRGQSMGIRL